MAKKKLKRVKLKDALTGGDIHLRRGLEVVESERFPAEDLEAWVHCGSAEWLDDVELEAKVEKKAKVERAVTPKAKENADLPGSAEKS